MSEIIIAEPFDIKIEIIDYEENVGSIRLLQKYTAGVLEDKVIEINTHSWVECKIWDAFVNDVYKITAGDNSIAQLRTMSDEIILEVRKVNIIMLTAYFDRSISNNSVHVKASIAAEIDSEQVNYLYEKLSSLAKWW